jgi:methylmalonyl-CoA epimerase
MGIIKRVDHVAIGVEDADAAKHFFSEVLGAEPLVDRGSSDAAKFTWDCFRLGDKKIELVSPHTSGEGGIGKYLAKYGEGYHHMTVAVENLDEAIAYFEEQGIRILHVDRSQPNFQHFFLHPKDTFGASIQIFEENDETLRLA